jgi:hypothetical protein
MSKQATPTSKFLPRLRNRNDEYSEVFLDAEWLKEILDIRETKWKSLDMETVFNP